MSNSNLSTRTAVASPAPDPELPALQAAARPLLGPEPAAEPQPDAATRRTTAVLALFIFLLSFKPSEPHLSSYLRSRGFTETQIDDEIYPVWTYAYALLLPLLAPWAEPTGYTPVILVGALGRMATRLLLLFGTELWQMQVMQLCYALGSVAEVVFVAYVFQLVPLAQFQRVTSVTQAAYMGGHVLGGLGGDLLYTVLGCSMRLLFWISAGTVAASLGVAVLAFPRVERRHGERPTAASALRELHGVMATRGFPQLAAWWAAAYAVYGFVYGYETSLYDELGAAADYNGTVYAAALLGGAGAAMLPTRAPLATVPVARVVGAATAVCSVCVLAMASGAVLPTLAGFVAYMAAWEVSLTVFYADTARRVADAHFSVVFTALSFAALLVQALLNAVLFSWLQLSVLAAFRVLFVVLSVASGGYVVWGSLWG